MLCDATYRCGMKYADDGNRGDGASGKTSLLNVFTRGYVARNIVSIWSLPKPLLIKLVATSRLFTSPPSSKTTFTVCAAGPGTERAGLLTGVSDQTSSSTMFISNFLSGIQQDRKNSTAYDHSHTVWPSPDNDLYMYPETVILIEPP